MSPVTPRAAAVDEALRRALRPESVVAHEGALELRICAGTACHASGRLAVREAIKTELAALGLTDAVPIVETGCHGFCEQGPIVVVHPKGLFYPHVRPQDVPAIIAAGVQGVEGAADKILYRDPVSGEALAYEADIPFYKGQRRLVLALNGKIDPYSIDDYLVNGGYAALAETLADDDPEAVIAVVARSGLRGRGGAGFSTGTKWDFARKAKGDIKYVICNADEGDPGAFMDRSVLEGNPHVILEGMTIAAYAIGAHEGYVYVRAEYPFAVERLGAAIVQARERGLLGADILGSGFAFDVHISEGAGAFVCGEETALIASIEGKRGMPRTRPPFPAVSGLWGRPTNINNVETFANIPWIVRHGAEAFAEMGMGDIARHQDLLAHRQGGQRRPGRGADGRHAAAHHLRRSAAACCRGVPSRPCSSAGPRAVACPPGCSTRRSTTRCWPPRARSWVPAAWSWSTTPPAWSTWHATSCSSRRTNRAASACPAVWAPSACSRRSCVSPPATGARETSNCSRSFPRTSSRARCARSAARRPTRCSPRCATSAMSWRRTSTRSAARPVAARRSSRTTSTPRPVPAARSAPASARPHASPARRSCRTSSTPAPASSATPAGRCASSARSRSGPAASRRRRSSATGE